MVGIQEILETVTSLNLRLPIQILGGVNFFFVIGKRYI